MNEGTHSGKSTIRLLGISAERPTNGLYFLPYSDPVAAETLSVDEDVLFYCAAK
jgi:hypothetical protein